jgi:hypothetical protein
MYVWIWRHLPGNGGVRMAVAAALISLILLGLLLVVFPAVDHLLPFVQVGVGSE